MNIQEKETNEEIDLSHLFSTFWKARLFLISFSFLFSVFFALYSLTLPNIYKSNSTLIGAEATKNSALSEYSEIASLAGINMPEGSASKTDLTLMVLESKDFFDNLYSNESFLINLLAFDSYDLDTKEVKLDHSIYNNGNWIVPRPKLLSTHKLFFDNHFSINYDKFSGTIYLSMMHKSPEIANSWLREIISIINSTMKEKDVTEAKKSLDYLNKKLKETNISQLQKGISDLILQQIQVINLAEITDEYALKVVDSPSYPEKRSSPYRTWLTIMGSLMGFIISSFMVLIFYYSKKEIHLSLIPPKIHIKELI